MNKNNNPWVKIIDTIEDNRCVRKGDNCPKVGSIIALSGEIKLESCHNQNDNAEFCDHAEALVIEKLIKKFSIEKINLKECEFYTSLEPCNKRIRYKVPCAHQIATLGFKKVYVSMLDPDPNIFGRGVSYLINNCGVDYVDYSNKDIRKKIIDINSPFIKSREKTFSFEEFKNKFPIYTGYDDEMYLQLAHAIARMGEWSKVVWMFPQLPTFSDKHKFHAWWAQGLLQSKKNSIDRIELIIHNDDWNDGIEKAISNCTHNMLLDEFSSINRPSLKLLRKDHNDKNCECLKFYGGLFYKESKLECLMLPFYSNMLDVPITTFLVCEPKYLALITKSKTEDVIQNLNDIYKSAIDNKRFEQFHSRLENDINEKLECNNKNEQ